MGRGRGRGGGRAGPHSQSEALRAGGADALAGTLGPQTLQPEEAPHLLPNITDYRAEECDYKEAASKVQ